MKLLKMENFEYFNVTHETETSLVFTPKEIIKDIIYDKSNNIIPFTNGQCYFVYQDITFKIMEYLENYPHISLKLVKEKLPKIILTNIKDDEFDLILKATNTILTSYINKKFSLFY